MEKYAAISAAVLTSFYFLRKYFCGSKYQKDTRIDGKIVIITGANSGIGFETACDLASRGGKIYLACRDEDKANVAVEKIKGRSGNKNVFFLQLDLASTNSIRKFSKKFHEIENRLDVLINNAAVFNIPQNITRDGFETQMGVNHLGHFLLTHLLLDLLKSSAPSRILNIVSIVHFMGKIERDNLLSEKSYSRKGAYNNSKLANVLFTKALSKRLEGTGVTVNAVRPGAAKTELHRDTNIFEYLLLVLAFLPIIKTPFEAAQTPIMVAVDPGLEKVSGKYFDQCKEKSFFKSACDEEAEEWLWNKSLELVGM